MKRTVCLAICLVVLASSVFASSGPFTTRIAFTSDRDGNQEIYTMIPNGANQTRLTNNTATDTQASFSPDGKKIAFMSDRDGNDEIYVMNANGTAQTRLTDDPASDSQPTWSPDGTRIAFQSNRGGGFDIFTMNTSGGGVVQLTAEPGFDIDPSFSPTGTKIAFTSSRDGNFEIYSMNANGSSQTRLTNNLFFEGRPDFSPDGTRIAFNRNVASNGGFTKQVMIMNADGTNGTVLTSAGANGNPVFSPDGTRIFFDSTRNLPTEIFSMAVDGSNEVRITNNTSGDTTPSPQGTFEAEPFAVFRPSLGKWILSTETESPSINLTVDFGQPGDLPVSGNWDGDTRTDIGVFRDGTFHLALLKTSFTGITVIEELPPFTFGLPGDLPVAGDWDGDGKDEVGVFRPRVNGRFFLRQPNGASIAFNFGTLGDLPVAGDWNGDGIETVGIYRPGDAGLFRLTNSFANVVDVQFNIGGPDALPLAGDWFASGHDGVGLFVPSSSLMVLLPELFSKPSFFFSFGQSGDLPVAGSWLP